MQMMSRDYKSTLSPIMLTSNLGTLRLNPLEPTGERSGEGCSFAASHPDGQTGEIDGCAAGVSSNMDNAPQGGTRLGWRGALAGFTNNGYGKGRCNTYFIFVSSVINTLVRRVCNAKDCKYKVLVTNLSYVRCIPKAAYVILHLITLRN